MVARDVVATGCFANDSWDSTTARSRQDGAARDFIIVRMSSWKMKLAVVGREGLSRNFGQLYLSLISLQKNKSNTCCAVIVWYFDNDHLAPVTLVFFDNSTSCYAVHGLVGTGGKAGSAE